MQSHVTKSNWPTAIEATLEAVLHVAALFPAGSVEAEVLVVEATQLRRLREMVRDRAPENREPMTSYLIAISVREGLSFPEEIINCVGNVYKVYKLWRQELVWQG